LGKVHAVYLLAVALAVIVLFWAAPAARYYHITAAPTWARAALLAAALQIAYLAWMVLTPDWSTVGVVAWVLATVAATYAVVLAVVLFTRPVDLPLGLESVERHAASWCVAAVLLCGLGSYLAARLSHQWRKSQATR
jgi:hypothetical protein